MVAPDVSGPSVEVVQSRRNIAATVAAAIAGVAVAAAPSPGGRRGLDLGGCTACGYVFFVFTFQNSFTEWPELGPEVLALLGAGLGSLLAPRGLQAWGLWRAPWVRAAAWAVDAAVLAASYTWMVRGPRPDLRPGSQRGRTAIITGCNTGIGYETAAALAREGGKVVFACRSEERARAAMKRLVAESRGRVAEEQLLFLQLDVSSLASVERFAQQIQERKVLFQTLILNAGVMLRSRKLSEDGFEMTMVSNHFGHFALVQRVLPALLEAEARGELPRIVVVGSNLCYKIKQFDFSEVVRITDEAEKAKFLAKPYDLFTAYSQSKLANNLFVKELARRLASRGSRIPVNAVHPGEVLTEVMRDLPPVILAMHHVSRPLLLPFFKTPYQGSFSTVHVATAPGLATSASASGSFFVRLRPTPHPQAAEEAGVAERLWALSESLTGTKAPL